jgi:hypothetical protein
MREGFASFAFKIIPIIGFAVFIGSGNKIDLSRMIIALLYFERMFSVLKFLPGFSVKIMQTKLYFKLLEEFLKLPEV